MTIYLFCIEGFARLQSLLVHSCLIFIRLTKGAEPIPNYNLNLAKRISLICGRLDVFPRPPKLLYKGRLIQTLTRIQSLSFRCLVKKLLWQKARLSVLLR